LAYSALTRNSTNSDVGAQIIAGSGEFGVNDAIITPDTTVMVADIQTDLSAKYKSPLSVGLGFGWQIGNARIQ